MTGCFHCGEPLPAGAEFSATLDGASRRFCCPGCQAVAETIIDCGLGSYYQHRTGTAPRAEALPDELRRLQHYDLDEIQQDFVLERDHLREVQLSIGGLSCAACAWLIERHLSQVPGVRLIQVNTTTERARLRWDERETRLSTLLAAFAHIGYQARPFLPHQQEQDYNREVKSYLLRMGVAGIASMQVMMVGFALYEDLFPDIDAGLVQLFRWVSLWLSVPVMGYSALPFYRNAWRGLKNRALNMDLPVSLAMLFAFVASVYATVTASGEVYYECVSMFAFLLLTGRFLEMRAKRRASETTANLTHHIPMLARLETGSDEQEVAARTLVPGQVVRVSPGAVIPADGDILEGHTSIDESMLTGEHLPVFRGPDEPVFAGTTNVESPLRIRVSRSLADARVSEILRAQDDALLDKPRVAVLADQLSRYFVAALLLATLGTWLVWLQLDADRAFWVMLSVLVATCPCALSLATPTALTVATSRLTQSGVLVRRAHVLDTLPRATRMVFDKTGTLTQGKVALAEVTPLGSQSDAQLLALAAALEAGSEHPIARAFSPHANAAIQVEQRQNHVGRGVSGMIDGQEWRLGSAAWLNPGAEDSELCVYLAGEQGLEARFVLADPLRDEAPELVRRCHEQGLNTTILTGDGSGQADRVAETLGVSELRKNASPDDKLAYLRQRAEQGEVCLMVGDGINDAPVLAGAHVSFAMAGGTDIAKNSADAILLGDSLQRLLSARRIAAATRRVIKQNFSWALGYNLVVLPLAAMGQVSPWFAMIGMSASSLIVMSNSLRLSRL
ncbi:copper-translocating P-type ATPase [Oceanimonas sp. GK1]|uniref:heavy metal translocating P-type ATPase n=1 Tax=Oceanimonas sp. (strain GK1 / IBRC-M 10197) TaxID=511062 RepID=UPI00024950F0|nr:heavy metal translocating P-type ATPase [Oceanimonas sp. GK1]AEY01806.1 copper-translocating P-type ATPase [Oceanimonas sp. GK1]